MSEVYLAYDPEHSRPIAVKVLPQEMAKNSHFVERFVREGEMGQVLDHPNIVRCYESGQDAETGQRYLVLEFIKGHSAQTWLEKKGPFPLAQATQIIIDIARALEHLHHLGIVHRDVKPGNILIGEDGRAKLADMGVGKSFSNKSDLTTHDQGVGTPLYMPWEQTLNATLVDARSDLFALGATYYHLVTGRVPFPGKSIAEVNQLKDEGTFALPRSINPALPAIFDSIVSKMLARLPAERYQTADDLIAALRLSGLADEHVGTAQMLADGDPPEDHMCPDQTLVSPEQEATPNANTTGVWYVRYENPIQGEIQIRAKTADIFKYVLEGLLPDDFYVGRVGEKKLRPVRTFAEFKNLPRSKSNTAQTPRRP